MLVLTMAVLTIHPGHDLPAEGVAVVVGMLRQHEFRHLLRARLPHLRRLGRAEIASPTAFLAAPTAAFAFTGPNAASASTAPGTSGPLALRERAQCSDRLCLQPLPLLPQPAPLARELVGVALLDAVGYDGRQLHLQPRVA